MVPSRWRQIVAVVSLGLALTCTTAEAQKFSAPMNVSSNSDDSLTPQVAVDAAGNIYVVWEDDFEVQPGIFRSDISFSRSIDGGMTFSPTPKNLSKSLGFSFDPRISVEPGGAIDVVWVDDTPGNQDIFFSRSIDGGVNFSDPRNLSAPQNPDPPDSASPQIAVGAGGNISVVWENDDISFGIFFSHSSDGGITFSSPVNLAKNPNGSFSPQLAVDADGNINVVWEDDLEVQPGIFQSDISFARSTDNFATPSAPTNLSNNAGNSFSPQIVVDASGNINVLWVDNTRRVDNPLGNFEILFSRSVDKGASFSTSPTNVSKSSGSAGSPQIAMDGSGNILVVWQENIPPAFNREIFFARSGDGGANFSTQNLSSNSGNSTLPWLTVDPAGKVNVSWQDSTAGNGDIFFTQSVDAGATFTLPPQNLSGGTDLSSPGLSSDVQIAADKNSNLNVVWADFTPGVSQIFFSRFSNPQKVNQPPVAIAGPDQILQSAGPAGTPVTLDGSASRDPDGDALTFQWKDENNNVVGNSAIVSLTVAKGVHPFMLTVTDPGGLSSSDVTHVTILNRPPVAKAGPDQTLECAGHGGTPVTLNGSGSSDPDGDALSFAWTDEANNVVGRTAVVQLALAMGTHTFTLTVTDTGDLTSTATTHVTVRDTIAPTLLVSLLPNVLWPANHKLVQITATIDTSDTCDPDPAIKLVSITSSDPDSGGRGGNHANDIQAVGGGVVPFGTDVRSFLLRAERSDKNVARVYTVTYSAKDASGNVTLTAAQVFVGDSTFNPGRKHLHGKMR